MPSSTERPTVALVGPVAPYRGGIAHFSNRLSQALAERADVRLVNFSRQYPKLLFPGESQFEDTPWALPTTPLRMLDSVNPATWIRTGRALAAMRAESVVFVHWLPFFVPAYLVALWEMRRHAKRLGLDAPKVTLFLHNVKPHKRFPMTKPLMQALIGAADRYFTLSEHVTKDLQAMKPSADVYEGFHPLYDHYAPAYDPAAARAHLGLPEGPTLLFFGYIRPYKGLDVLLEAMPEIHRRTGARLIVAGEFYNNEDELRGRVQALGLDGSDGTPPVVRFFSSYIANEEVHHYFSAADALVQPYRSATPSGVAQTAFFFGKPMVTTNLGVFAEVVPDGVAGVLVPPEDPQALADGVARFYAIGADTLAEGAAAQAERFSWDALVDRLLPFLTKR